MTTATLDWKTETPVSTNRVKCGNRKVHGTDVVYHDSPEAVRACYTGTAHQSHAPAVVSTPAPAPAPAAPAQDRVVGNYAEWRKIPVGAYDTAYYALRTHDGHIGFFRVRRPSTGKYAGKTYVDRQSGDNFERLTFREVCLVLNKIAVSPLDAAVLYGKEIQQCAMCHRSLTDDTNRGKDGLTSLERGIGPDCAKKVGLV